MDSKQISDLYKEIEASFDKQLDKLAYDIADSIFNGALDRGAIFWDKDHTNSADNAVINGYVIEGVASDFFIKISFALAKRTLDKEAAKVKEESLK